MNEALDEILHKLKVDAADARASCESRKNWEDYQIKYDRFEAEARAKIQRIIVEAKHGIVINALNLLNTEPIHTVEQALLFDEERLTKELENDQL